MKGGVSVSGWIDIHTHILPGMDDGAQSMEDALNMARLAVKSGVTTVVATPHSRRTSQPARVAAEIESRVRALQYRLRCEEIPLRVLPGTEIFVTEATPTLLARGELLSLAGTRYALLEFSPEEDPAFIYTMLQAVVDVHFVPVVAHPERYFCVQEMPELVSDWREDGCLLQLNKGSLLGRFGDAARDAALQLLRDDAAATIASDAHTPFVRTTDMRPAVDFLNTVASPITVQRLLADNPRRILTDREFPSLSATEQLKKEIDL